MADLRLPRLPDRTPVKVGIQVTPQLFADLTRYAALYKETYGQEEAVAAWDVMADAAAVSRVRSESVRRMVSWGLEEAAFVTELVVSELVTNAIRYGVPPIQLRLIHDDVLTCEVSDASSTAPHMRRARVFDEGGRGLLLVAQLTQRWGTRQTSTGKTIWCEQSLPTEMTSTAPEPAKAA